MKGSSNGLVDPNVHVVWIVFGGFLEGVLERAWWVFGRSKGNLRAPGRCWELVGV